MKNKSLGCQIGLFENNDLLYCFQYESDKREVIKFINKTTEELTIKNYFNPERKIMYKLYTSTIPEKWSTLEELIEGGQIILAKN